MKAIHPLNDFFDEIYVFSSEEKFNNWVELNKYFIENNIYVTRFELATSIVLEKIKRDYQFNFDIKSGTLFKLFKYLDITNNSRILILDSTVNIKFNNSFKEDFKKTILEIRKNKWDIWYLGYDKTYRPKKQYYKSLFLSKETIGFFAVAINGYCYNYIINNMRIQKNKNKFNIELYIKNKFQGGPPLMIFTSSEKLISRK